MSIRTCHHVRDNGVLCQAAALRNRDYCRFHLQQIGRRMKAARARARHQAPVLKLPLLEDLYSVQVALMQLADAIACREIDPQSARQLTTVLRLAMQNLRSKQAWERSARFQLAENTEGAVTEWNTFEQEHDLPSDLDLSLEPEVAFPPPPEPETAPLEDAPQVDHARLRAKVGQILREAEAPGPRPFVSADQVELMEVYEQEGEQAMLKRAGEQFRNQVRRERRARRLHYEEVARKTNLQHAARELFEQEVRAGVLKPGMDPTEAWKAITHQGAERKASQGEADTEEPKAPAAGA